jgi:HrpA-like RNA helicase
VVFVIDCGRVRQLENDEKTSTPKLLQTWCSRASGKQRAGRAGRVQPGLCLKLFSSRTEKYVMRERSEPELRRIPLEEVCLNVLAAGYATNCRSFLSQTPQPPPEDAIMSALLSLRDVGAVAFAEPEYSFSPAVIDHEELTPLGRHLAKLPLDVCLGKMLIFGVLFKCIDPIASIAACLSATKSVFLSDSDSSTRAQAAHARFRHPDSDFQTLRNVFEAFVEADLIGQSSKFCRDNFLNLSSLIEARDAKALHLDLLCSIGFMNRKLIGLDNNRRSFNNKVLSSCAFNVNGANDAVVDLVVFSGVYPFVACLQTPNGKGKRPLLHKTQELFIHSTSVNYKLPTYTPSPFVAFHEKFGTANRVTVSTTCFVHPMAIMLFGSVVNVKHIDREVLVDGWISLKAAATTGVLFRELRNQLDTTLKEAIENAGAMSGSRSTVLSLNVSTIIDGIVELL